MTTANATPKPRAGEYKRWADQYDLDRSDPATRLFIAASNWVDRCEAAEAERDLLRERERELVDVLRELLDVTKRANIEVPMSDAPVFFAARELLAKHGR